MWNCEFDQVNEKYPLFLSQSKMHVSIKSLYPLICHNYHNRVSSETSDENLQVLFLVHGIDFECGKHFSVYRSNEFIFIVILVLLSCTNIVGQHANLCAHIRIRVSSLKVVIVCVLNFIWGRHKMKRAKQNIEKQIIFKCQRKKRKTNPTKVETSRKHA